MNLRSRLHQITIAISQLANTLVWVGDTYADEMLCAKAWRLRYKGWGWLVIILDAIWFWDPEHCYKCYAEEMRRLYMPDEYKKDMSNDQTN